MFEQVRPQVMPEWILPVQKVPVKTFQFEKVGSHTIYIYLEAQVHPAHKRKMYLDPSLVKS